ncbi:MAG: hypothetical protein EBS98_10310 [Chitinophagia bacterium]|nr:hypothetical protein [Chitinophagia bacterium]
MTNTGTETIKYSELKAVILRFLNYFISQYKLILYITLITSALGLVYGKLQPSTYKATSTFIVEDKSGKGGGGLSGLASQFGIDVGGLTGGGAGLFDGDNILEIIKSRAIVEKVLLTKMEEPASSKGQTIADYYIQIENLAPAFESKNINVKSLNFAGLTEGVKHTVQQDSILYILFSRINKDLNVEKKNKKSTIITLEVVSGDQVFSKVFAEQVLKQTSDLYIDIKTGNLSRSINKIQQKADSLQNSLTGIYQKSFQAENATKLYNVNSSLRINTSQSEIAARDKTVSSTLYAEVVKNLETLKLSLINQTPVIQVLDTPKFPLFDQRTPARYFLLIGFAVGIVLSFFYALYKYTSN